MSDRVSLPMASATAAQLREFAQTVLGLDIPLTLAAPKQCVQALPRRNVQCCAPGGQARNILGCQRPQHVNPLLNSRRELKCQEA